MATQLWAWQDGTPTDDGLNAVAMGSDGSSVWAGYSNWNTSTADATGTLWAAVKLDADGTVLWKWEDQTAGCDDNRINAAAMCQDGSVVLAGVGGDDFHVIKLDNDGDLLWHFQDGSGDEDIAGGIAMGEDGSVVVAGTVSGDWDIPNLGVTDMAAFKLDANGTLLWKWQGGTVGHDLANAVAMAKDGSVVIAGHSRGDLLDRANDENDDDSTSLFPQWLVGDFAAIKLDSGGAELWRWQDGGSGFDRLNAVAMAKDGSCVLAGYTSGDWDVQYNVGGNDFAAVKLDADGDEIWRWQDGTVDDDLLQGVHVKADGTVLLGGHTEGDWNGLNAGGRDFALVELDRSGDEMWRWQGGSADTGEARLDDVLNAMAAGADGKILLAGRTRGSWGKTNLGEGDFMGLMLDAHTLFSESPTPAPSAVSGTRPVQPFTPSLTDDDADAGAGAVAASGSGSSDSTPVVAGVLSALAGVALLALGVFLRKRHITKTNAAASAQTSLPVVGGDVDGGNDPPPYQPQQERELPSGMAPAAAAAAVAGAIAGGPGDDYDGRSGGTSPPLPPAYAEAVQHPAEATVHAGRHGGGGSGGGGGGGKSGDIGGVSPVEGGFMPTTRQSEDAVGGDGGGGGGSGGDYSLEAGGTEASGQARKKASVDSGFDGGGSLPKGSKSPASITGKPGGAGISAASTATAALEQGGSSIDVESESALIVTASTANISTGGRYEFTPAYHEGDDPAAALTSVTDEAEASLGETGGSSSSTARRRPSSGPGLGRAVGEAALELARSSQIPGVSEAAVAVSVLVNLLMDNQDNKKSSEASVRRCRSIVTMLERASKVLGKGGETTKKAERDMIEDVLDAIFDLVELIKTYQSKNKLAQLMTSTLFRRRQDEMGAVVDRAVLGLQLGLHVRVGTDVSSIKEDVSAFKEGMHVFQGSIEEAQSKSLAEARSAKRKRRLDQLEIPANHVTITDELLGKGGFGEVYLADYNGRNAAAKVLHISHDLGRRGENAILDGSTSGQVKRKREETQRKAFLLELGTMIRLRSPYTVDVYGAVTSIHDRLILVMELLAGGDLRTLLKNAEQPLPEKQCWQIIGDICAGMAFLHTKKTVHGDLKSANVLLDGAGRAKIGDFGTSRWTQHTMSTGLATFTTKSSTSTQMSLAWSAPEVLDAEGSTYASDVYSFGVVVWEVISRDLPWAAVTHPKDVYIRVVLKNIRPAIPDDAPAKIANVARSCWAGEAGERPTFSSILEGIKANGWEQ